MKKQPVTKEDYLSLDFATKPNMEAAEYNWKYTNGMIRDIVIAKADKVSTSLGLKPSFILKGRNPGKTVEVYYDGVHVLTGKWSGQSPSVTTLLDNKFSDTLKTI